jgi:hypothetical protein
VAFVELDHRDIHGLFFSSFNHVFFLLALQIVTESIETLLINERVELLLEFEGLGLDLVQVDFRDVKEEGSRQVVQILNEFGGDLYFGFGVGRCADILKNGVLEVLSKVEGEISFARVL